MEEGARRILNMNFNYFYKTQADEFSFIRIPKALMTEEVFSDWNVNTLSDSFYKVCNLNCIGV